MLTYNVTQGFMLEKEKAIFTGKSEHQLLHPEDIVELVQSIAPELPVDFSITEDEGMYLFDENFFVHYELVGHDKNGVWKTALA